MERIKFYFSKIGETKNPLYASPLKRLASFAVDTIIIVLMFNGVNLVLSRFGIDTEFRKEEIIIENKGSEDENVSMKETIDKKIFTRSFYIFGTIASLYFSLFLASKKQATIGNQIFRIMVVHTKRTRLNILDGFIRFLLLLINNKLFGAGYLTYFFNQDKAFLQDLLSDTRVINIK